MNRLGWLTALLRADVATFVAINSRLGAGVVGNAFALVTHLGDWGAVWLLLCALILWRGHGSDESHRTVVLTITGMLFAELVTWLAKDAVGRPRPYEVLPHVRLLVVPPGGYSFPSAHAMRSFVAAGVLSRYLSNRRWSPYALAALIAFSRIVVGVHFPGDVLAGALIGLLIAWLFSRLGVVWRRSVTDGRGGDP